MWDDRAVILDFQCFLNDEGNDVIKELSVMDVTRFVSRHWIFKPPAANNVVTTPQYIRTNQWLSEHYHGLRWDEGETPYEDLVFVLTTYTSRYTYVFVKGLQKKQFLIKHIIHNNIINLEDYDCPKLSHLTPVQGTVCLTHHAFRVACTCHRVNALRDWMISDYRIVSKYLL
jgi:hypothetical protein